MNSSGVFFYLELWYLKLVTLPSNFSAVNLKLFVGYKKTQLFGYVEWSFYVHFPSRKQHHEPVCFSLMHIFILNVR